MKASELIGIQIRGYVSKNHPNMSIKDFQVIMSVIQDFYKKPVIDVLEKLFQSFLPEVKFDKDNLEKMKRTNDFLSDFCEKHCGGILNYELWKKLTIHYNLSRKDTVQFLDNAHKQAMDLDRNNLYVYEAFKKYIDKNLYRKRKLERILG